MTESRIKVLDCGYFEVVETWGSDEKIIEAARMSTGKGFNGWGPKHSLMCGYVGMEDDPQQSCTCGHNTPGDEKLLAFLWNNKHATPFEMAGMVVEVKAPIMVFREWHRHRTQSYNEMSARYTPLPDENYYPSLDRLMLGSDGKNRQAGTIAGAAVLTDEAAMEWLDHLRVAYDMAQAVYEQGLKLGVPKELARLPVPVGRYSRMRASANLRNWLAFLTLRSDHVLSGKAAQYEIRQYANVLGEAISRHFPRTFDLFVGKAE